MFYDGYTIDENGLMERVNDEGHNLYDVIYNKKNYSSENRLDYDISGNRTGIKISKGIVKRNANESRNMSYNYAHRSFKFKEEDLEGYPTGKYFTAHIYEVASDAESLAIMNFMDKNTNIEWGNTLIKKDDGTYFNLLITSHEYDKIVGFNHMINVLLKEQKGIVVRFDHIHPRSAKYGHKASYGDMAVKEKLQEMFKVTTRILSKGKYYEY